MKLSVPHPPFTSHRPCGLRTTQLAAFPARQPCRKGLLSLPPTCALTLILLAGQGFCAEPRRERAELPSFDFKSLPEAAEWYSVNVVSLTPGLDGLVIRIANEEPHLIGPVREFPANQPLCLHLRLKSERGGKAQVFYFQNEPKEADSVRFEVPAGQWYEAVVALPPLAGLWRLRLDPPGGIGRCVLDHLWFEVSVQAPGA